MFYYREIRMLYPRGLGWRSNSEAMAERGEAIVEPWRGDGETVAKRWRNVAKR